MKNKYDELREIHQKRVDEFPLMFAFNQEQFDNGMKNWGLEPDDTDKIYSIGGGGYIRKTDLDAYNKLWEDIRKEHNELIEKDKTGDGYIKDMFISELENHEYSYTRDISSTLDALELTYEDIRNNPTLKKGLDLAINEIIGNELLSYSQPVENLATLQGSIHDDNAESMGLNTIRKERNAAIINTIVNFPLKPFATKENLRKVIEAVAEEKKKKEEVGNMSSKDFLETVRNEFNENVVSVWSILEEKSKAFWLSNSLDIKDKLCRIVTNNQDIPEERKEYLKDKIMKFEKLSFDDDVDLIFTQDNFKRKIGKPYQFIESKVETIFQNEMKKHIDDSRDRIMESHLNSFNIWLEKLKEVISSNIMDLNMDLKIRHDQINKLSDELEEAMKNKIKLEEFKNRIQDLIGWKKY